VIKLLLCQGRGSTAILATLPATRRTPSPPPAPPSPDNRPDRLLRRPAPLSPRRGGRRSQPGGGASIGGGNGQQEQQQGQGGGDGARQGHCLRVPAGNVRGARAPHRPEAHSSLLRLKEMWRSASCQLFESHRPRTIRMATNAKPIGAFGGKLFMGTPCRGFVPAIDEAVGVSGSGGFRSV
jgi:hypothetical protein